MSNKTENGLAITVANYEDLINFCIAYGATYNPSKASLKTDALTTQLTNARAALLATVTAKTAYDNATNLREVAFKPLKQLGLKIIYAMAATDVLEQTMDDARTVNNKIQGRRATAIKKPEAQASPVKTSSTSQLSFDSMVEHYVKLVALLAAETNYQPNENELKVATLNTMITDLRNKNTAVINAATVLSNARIARDKALYAKTTGLVDTAKAVKLYVKSIFGLKSPQYKQLIGLEFRKRSGD